MEPLSYSQRSLTAEDYSKMSRWGATIAFHDEIANRPKHVKDRIAALNGEIEKAKEAGDNEKYNELCAEQSSLTMFPHNPVYQKIYKAKRLEKSDDEIKEEVLNNLSEKERDGIMQSYHKAYKDTVLKNRACRKARGIVSTIRITRY